MDINPPARDYSETRLQIAVTSYLKGEIQNGRHIIRIQKPFPGLLFTHPANEGRSAGEGMKYKRMGVLAGVADFLFWWEGRGAGAIELKTHSGTSPSQKDFKAHFEETGFPYAICKSVTEVRDTLISWGLECKNTACHEPKESKEFYKRVAMELLKQ